MSDYLREILGAGKHDSNQSQLLGLVAADIPSADGEGANEGFWRVQLRDRLGTWAKMFGNVLFDIDIEGLGRLTGHGQLVSMARPGVGIVRVKNHPVLPDNDYEVAGENLESLVALISDEEYKRITEQGVNNKKPVARISDEDYARLVKDAADSVAGLGGTKDKLTGAEVQARKMSTVYKNLKNNGRFPVPRQTDISHWGEDSDIAKGAKDDYNLVYKNLKNQDPSWETKYPTFDAFWDRVKQLSVGQTSQSPNDLNDIPQEMKDINKAYAETILGLKPDGKITFYRNAVNKKGTPEESAVGYVTTNADFAYDYNSQAPNTDGNGRYEIDAKPDEIFGMLGYSQIEDEFGVTVGRGVTSQPDRVRRVGDLEQPKLAPWLEQYQAGVRRLAGSTPYRHYALAGQFDLLPVDPLGDNLDEFLQKHGKTSADIKAKFDEIYGDGAYDAYKASGNGTTFSNIKNMFIDAGDGKVGLDITKIDGTDNGYLAPSSYGDGDPDSFKNDRVDNTLKMLSVFQELSGQPFMVHRDHPKDDPRLPAELAKESKEPELEESPGYTLKPDSDLGDAEEQLRQALDGFKDYQPREEPSDLDEVDDATPEGVTHTFLGKEYYFSPEELEKARNYISSDYAGAQNVTDEEGKAFNERMRALTDFKSPGTVTDETLPAQRKYMGLPIPVKELRHSAPTVRFDEIVKNGIRPGITNKVGSEKYKARRFGVFLANGYTSGEAGERADVFRVKVPENDLRVDSGYTPNGNNLYIERTIKPEELEHIGHYPVKDSIFGDTLHSGRGAECKDCDIAEKKRQDAEQKREKEKQEKYSTPIVIFQLKYQDGSLAESHWVQYKSGEDEIHTHTHSIEDCPEIAKNPNVVIRPEGLKENETLAEMIAEVEKSSDVTSDIGPSIWGRLKLRSIKDRLGFTLEDLEVSKLVDKYSNSDEEIDTLEKTLLEEGIFEKAKPGDFDNFPDVSNIPDLSTPERTEEAKDAIAAYRGWGYLDLKNHIDSIYGNPDKTEEERKKLDQVVEELDRITSTEQLPEGSIIYRGIALSKDPEWYEYFSEIKPGDKLLTPNMFTSTTLDPVIADEYSMPGSQRPSDIKDLKSVVMKITTKKGATGSIFENDKTVFSREKEVLLPLMANISVTNVYKDSDGILRIDAEYGPKTNETPEIHLNEENGPSIEEMVKDIEENPEKYPPLLPEEPKTTTPEEEQKGADYEFAGEKYYFTPEELQKAVFYVSGGAGGAQDLTEEEGKEFNKRMRALSAYVNQKNGNAYKMSTTESIDSQSEANGSPIEIDELRHSAPPYRFDEITKNGIKPKVTDKVGTDGYKKRRYGVFLANGYTSDEAGVGADIFRVNNIPTDELRVDAGYTRNGRNLYIERTIKPEELELLGHMPINSLDESLINKEGLHDGNSAKCTVCHPELKAVEPKTPRTLTSADEGADQFWDTDKMDYELKADAVEAISKTMLNLGIDLEKLDAFNRTLVSMYDTGTNDPYSVDWEGSIQYGQIMIANREDGIFVPLARAVNRSISNGTQDLAEYLKSMSSSGDYNFTMEDVRKMLDQISPKDTDYKLFKDKEYKLYQDISDSERADMAVSALIKNWAATSNGDLPQSLALQEIAKSVFGIESARDRYMRPKTREDIEKVKQEYGDVLEAFLRAQHDLTQKRFKDAGITEVVLYRGLADISIGKTLSDEKLTEVDAKSSPLSSWSTDAGTAYWFATGGFGTDYEAGEARFDPEVDGAGAVMFRRVVPIEQILATPFTGVGCYNEKEMVVIGGEMKVDAVSATEEDNLMKVINQATENWNPLTGIETSAEKKERIEPGFKNWYKKIQDIFTEADEDYDESRGNVLQSVFLEKAGFNDKPQVLSQKDFDAIEGESFYRGFVSTEFMDDYINSDLQFAGEGYFGNGTYTSNKKETTLTYTGSDDSNREDRVMEMKLLPDANAISFDEATDLSEWAKQVTLDFIKGYDKSGATFEQFQDAEWRLSNDSDFTNIAIMLGIDAIRFKVPLTPNEEYYTIILNRGKVAINGKS